MTRLARHLDSLLAIHDCVVIPTLGAIIKEQKSPYFVQEEGVLYPGTISYHFNKELKERDGFLESSYAKNYGFSLRRASLMVQEDVELIRESLLEKGEFTLNTIGKFKLTDSGALEFFSEDFSNKKYAQGDFYGFSPVTTTSFSSYFVPKTYQIQKNKQSTPAKDPNYLHVRIHKKSMGWIAASVVLFLSLYPISTTREKTHFSASIIPVQSVETPQKDSEYPVDLQVSALVKEDGKATAIINEDLSQKDARKDYFVVIGAFRTEKKTEEFINSCSDAPFYETIGFIYKNHRNMIYANRFETMEEARNYSLELKKSKTYQKDSWILHYSQE